MKTRPRTPPPKTPEGRPDAFKDPPALDPTMDAEALRDAVRTTAPDAQVHPTDLTGGGDHWHCVVVSERFQGLMPVERQRMVMAPLKGAFADGTLHALDLRCLTPEELEKRHGGRLPEPFLPHGRGEGEHPGAWD